MDICSTNFKMAPLMRFLITPLTTFWIILLTGIVFFLLSRKRTGLVFCFISISWLAIISFPFVPHLLVKSLENRFPPLLETSQFMPTGITYILVLGGGHSENINLPHNDQLSLNSLCRLSEGIRLYRLLPSNWLIFSGITKGQK